MSSHHHGVFYVFFPHIPHTEIERSNGWADRFGSLHVFMKSNFISVRGLNCRCYYSVGTYLLLLLMLILQNVLFYGCSEVEVVNARDVQASNFLLRKYCAALYNFTTTLWIVLLWNRTGKNDESMTEWPMSHSSAMTVELQLLVCFKVINEAPWIKLSSELIV